MKYIFYIKNFNIVLLLLNNLSIMISGCSYDVYTITSDIQKSNFPVIALYSFDPYGFMTMITKDKLRINKIPYFDCTIYERIKPKQTSCISLYIINTSEKYIRTSLFQNGQSAEYELILTVFIKIQINKDEPRPFRIKGSKSFFNNPETISGNFVKKNIIREEIYDEVSEELIEKLLFFIQTIYKH